MESFWLKLQGTLECKVQKCYRYRHYALISKRNVTNILRENLIFISARASFIENIWRANLTYQVRETLQRTSDAVLYTPLAIKINTRSLFIMFNGEYLIRSLTFCNNASLYSIIVAIHR